MLLETGTRGLEVSEVDVLQCAARQRPRPILGGTWSLHSLFAFSFFKGGHIW